MNALDLSFVEVLPSHRFCNDCVHACKTHCARITPGRHIRWNAFERIGLAAQHEPGAKRNAAYMAWIEGEWSAWHELNGHASRFQGEAVHAAFDAWLAARHDVPCAQLNERVGA